VSWAVPLRAASADPASFGADAIPPRLPGPFVFPALSHSGGDVGVDWFVGRHAPEGPDRPAAVAAIGLVSTEWNVLVPRRLFVGLTYPFAAALPPDGGLAPGEDALPSGRRILPGNAEGHVRAVFPLPTGLEIAFSLGVVAPTATFDRDLRSDRSAALAASSFDPTNVLYFLPGRVGLRPSGELRILRGPLLLQGRHGLDVFIDETGIDRAKVAGRLLAHVGVLVRRDLEVSVEASQMYFFASDEKVTGPPTPERAFAEKYRITDDRRAAMTMGPAVRYAMRDFDLGASLVTNLTDPLSPVSAGFVGLRVSVIGHVGGGPR
jgi:hypothetical protein